VSQGKKLLDQDSIHRFEVWRGNGGKKSRGKKARKGSCTSAKKGKNTGPEGVKAKGSSWRCTFATEQYGGIRGPFPGKTRKGIAGEVDDSKVFGGGGKTLWKVGIHCNSKKPQTTQTDPARVKNWVVVRRKKISAGPTLKADCPPIAKRG